MEATPAWESGIFGTILIGMSSLLLMLMSRALGLDPIVYCAAMAGVLAPAAMVAAGALARWAAAEDSPGTSLAAGLVTLSGGASLCLVMLAISSGGAFLPAAYFTGFDAPAYFGLLALVAAYVALSVIGGHLYGLIFPDGRSIRS